MSREQTKRRRKRYQPGSAYAGHVRPRGIFSIFGNVRLFYVVGAAIMLGSLGVGGFISSSAFLDGQGSDENPAGFVSPDDGKADDGTPEAGATAEVRQYPSPPAMSIDASKRYTATIKTELGDITVELLASEAPQTVNNFVFLAKDGFYQGLTFHQVAPGFSAQAGDPACSAGAAGCAGSGGPGYELPQERPGPFQSGTLGMANGSQFFIALTGSDRFTQYTPFARVTTGLDVAQRLTEGTTIESIEIQEP